MSISHVVDSDGFVILPLILAFKMKIYKDIVSGDELGSDSYPTKDVVVNGYPLFYELETKQVTRSIGNIDIGANPSGEEGAEDEGADDKAVTVNNMADAHRLVETSYDKKNYTAHIKAYLKRVSEKVAAAGKDQKAFQAAAQEYVGKTLIPKFDDYAFYTGETMDPEAMVVLKVYKEDGIIPYFLVWKDGVKEEKY